MADPTGTDTSNNGSSGADQAKYSGANGRSEYVMDSIYSVQGWSDREANIALGKESEPNPTYASDSGITEGQQLNSPSDYVGYDIQDDGSASNLIESMEFTDDDIFSQAAFNSIRHYAGLYYSDEINLYDQIYRFKIFNPDTAVSNFKEVLFFTKPDLSILTRGDDISDYPSVDNNLQDPLFSRPFWQDLRKGNKNVIRMLQGSIDRDDPFNRLLQNTVTSSIDIPALESEGVETAANMYGVNLSYRGSSEASDDSFSFSLEFRDTKWLDVYYFFRAYEEYETLKHHGIIAPWKPYIEQKILHDQFSIYKFLLDDDMETIRYYAKYYGVYPTSLPRDTFSQSSFENGIVYNVNFKAAFYEDMTPEILYDFNLLTNAMWNKSGLYKIESYNPILDRVDTRSAVTAKVVKYHSDLNPRGFEYKLKWKGDRKV